MTAADQGVPSPGDGDIVRLTDEGISEYIEFPEDTFFLESMAQNEKFAKGVAYVPAQRRLGENGENVETHVYEIRPEYKEAKHLFGPIESQHGTKLTVFGSALSSEGILYLCVFNKNAIIAYDMNKIPQSGEKALSFLEITDVPAPNDVCIDPNDESVLYVAGGTLRRLGCNVTFSNAAFGKVYRIRLSKNKQALQSSKFSRGYTSLAGIECVGDKIWVAQLFNMISVDVNTRTKVEVWKGNDGNGQVWLADNVDVFSDDYILVPAYSTASESSVDYVLSQKHLLGVGVFFAQLVTCCLHGEKVREALEDPEVALSFSNTYIKEGEKPLPIKLVFLKRDGSGCYHFELDLVQARQEHEPREIRDPKTKEVLGMRHFFNDQITHAARFQTADGSASYIACISFEQPRILLLKDEPFLEFLKSETACGTSLNSSIKVATK